MSDEAGKAGRGEQRAVDPVSAGLDDTDVRGFTPLLRAARRGDLEEIGRLLAAGADPDRRRTGADGWTPLMHALHAEQRAAVRLLLQRGADPNAAGQGGLTPLMMAASDGDAEMVRLLLDHGADPEARLFLGFTAFDYAVAHGHPRVARLLRSEEGPPARGRTPGAGDDRDEPGPGRRARFARQVTLWLAWAAGSPEMVSLLQSWSHSP